MKRIISYLSLLLIIFVIGCGGKKNNPIINTNTQDTGSLSIIIKWPDKYIKSKIPDTTKSILVTIYRKSDNAVIISELIKRNPQNTYESKTYELLIGEIKIVAEACSTENGFGIIARGSADVTIERQKGQTANITLEEVTPIEPPANYKIAFSSDYPTGYSQIYLMNPDGTGQTPPLTSGNYNNTSPSLSSDGNKIVFLSNRDGNYEIYIMNSDGNNQLRLTETPNDDEMLPSISPDGSKIVYTKDLFGGPLWIMNSDGNSQRQLLYKQDLDMFDPTFSPDSNKVAFAGIGYDANYNDTQGVYIYDILSGNLDPITTSSLNSSYIEGDMGPSFSPDGSKIVFSKFIQKDFMGSPAPYGEIFIMSSDGSGPITQLTDDAFPSQMGNFNPCFSPDGKKIFYHSLKTGNWQIYSMNVDDKIQTNITPNISWPFNAVLGSVGGVR